MNPNKPKDEWEALIPDQLFRLVSKATPEELEKSVKYSINIDDNSSIEILTAFSYYEALKPDERIKVKNGLSNTNVNYLLTYIGNNNEKLLDKIESMYDKGEKVIAWLENQINRIKAMSLVFDQMLADKLCPKS